MLFADDIIFVVETREEVNAKLDKMNDGDKSWSHEVSNRVRTRHST